MTKRWVDARGHRGLRVSQFEFHSVLSAGVVMHGHSCPYGPVINRGMGGGHKEENYKGVCERRLLSTAGWTLAAFR